MNSTRSISAFTLYFFASLLLFFNLAPIQVSADFRPYLFRASQKSGGELLSGGVSWNPQLISKGPFSSSWVLGTQLFKNTSGSLIPTFDLGPSVGVSVIERFRIEAQAVVLIAPFESTSWTGRLSSSTGALGAHLIWDRPFGGFDGLWIGFRRWLTADRVDEFRIGGSFHL